MKSERRGFFTTFTFDHILARNNFGFRLGVGSNLAKDLNAIAVGGGGYYLLGKTNRFLELGLDLQYLVVDEVTDDQKRFTLFYPDYSSKTIYPSLNLGYRAYAKWTLFRMGISPGLINGEFVPGGYISYGWRF